MIKPLKENQWEIPKTGKMNVPGLVFASEKLIKNIEADGKTLDQVRNVAKLPGIVGHSMAMPDAHQGYGFPIGGVAAFDTKKGIVSPGGVGYDINCGVRLLASNLDKKEFMPKREIVLHSLYRAVPSGVGRRSDFHLSEKELSEVLEKGVNWVIEKGYGTKKDIENCEDNGKIPGADASKVSPKAKGRGRNQLGTLGAGNHFLEVQEVEEIYDKEIARTFGLNKVGQICVMLHSGSRGLGHQVASDYIRAMENEYGFKHLPDRELSCAPIESPLGKDYRAAMAAAANFAFANRQVITYQIRKNVKHYFPKSEFKLVYDIAHNIAKFEEHKVNGKKTLVCVHRKGATRSFGPGNKEIPKPYQKTGCPIFVPGSMGTYSYVLAGTSEAEKISFASSAHGAGRALSRRFAMQNLKQEDIKKQLDKHGVHIEAGSKKGVVEEAPEAYKDVNEVVKVSHEAGIGKLVARLKPIGVVKS